MVKSYRLLFLFASFFMSVLPVGSSTLRIMGIGDSITEGGSSFSSYLGPLAHLMDGAGFSYEFVGTRTGFSAGVHYRHAAFGGKNAEYVSGHIEHIYRECPADIVLIHSGHNHFIEEKPVDGIVKAQSSMINTIKEINPNAVILVAGVIESGKLPKYGYIPELNKSLRKMVDAMNDSKVIYVNVGDGFDWRIHTVNDKVHPNLAGAYVMACNWFKVLNKLYCSSSDLSL